MVEIKLDELRVVDRPEKSRFEIDVDGEVAFVTYARGDGVIAYIHTEVPSALEGHGIAGVLAKHALDYARDAGLKVVPLCPYVRAYIERHSEYEAIVAPRAEWRPFLAH